MDKEELFAMAQAMDTEEYCMLESDTSRVIVVPDRYKTFGVEEDTNVERVKFKFPKIVGDNVDLTTLDLRINFQNASGGLDKYVVDDVAEADDGYITFSWVIQDGVTPQSGQISFVVQAVKATEDGTIENKWSTTLNKVGQVLEGLEVDETIEQQNPDIIESILTRLDELEENGGGGGTPGKDGREIELQNSGTAIQWRYEGDGAWTDLVQLSELKGDPGDDGVTPNIQIGTVQTLEPEQQATASVTGTTENPLLNLGIPKGGQGPAGDSGIVSRQEMQNTDAVVTLQPNILYVFPEMSSLTITLGTPADSNVANEYHFFFTSGATATTLTLNDVLSDAYSIEPNTKYEVSILENVAYIKGVAVNET